MNTERPLVTYTLTWFDAFGPHSMQSKSFQQLLGLALEAGPRAHPVIVDEKGDIKFPQPDRPNSGVVQVVTIYDPYELIAA